MMSYVVAFFWYFITVVIPSTVLAMYIAIALFLMLGGTCLMIYPRNTPASEDELSNYLQTGLYALVIGANMLLPFCVLIMESPLEGFVIAMAMEIGFAAGLLVYLYNALGKQILLVMVFIGIEAWMALSPSFTKLFR